MQANVEVGKKNSLITTNIQLSYFFNNTFFSFGYITDAIALAIEIQPTKYVQTYRGSS